jgi:hypothetical protein
MSFSRRTPSFGIMPTRSIMSPQEKHIKIGVLPVAGGERSMGEVEGV